MSEAIGNNIVYLEETTSTNEHLNEQFSKNAASNGTVVFTNNQLKGKGYHENKWESKTGQNLLLSIGLTPDWLEAEKQFYISKIISLGVHSYLRNYNPDIYIKWPNDIWYKQKKIAGILIENSIQGFTLKSSIIGIGININQSSFESNAPNPISLSQISGRKYELKAELQKLLTCINRFYPNLKNKQYAIIDKLYFQHLMGCDEYLKYTANDKTFMAKITGIGKYGTLQLISSDNEKLEFGFKEVELQI